MLKSDQTLEGDNSNQAGRDIHIINNYYELDIEKAEKILEEIFQKRLPYFTEIAEQTARERTKPVVKEIIREILQRKPEAISEFAEPEVQYVLGSAMKTASSTDDSVVHDTLVQLTVDHVLNEGKSYERIVDQQAIEVLQKMNRGILKSLQEVAFWNTPCVFVTEDTIMEYITDYFYPFSYQKHLVSIGCIAERNNDRNTIPRFFDFTKIAEERAKKLQIVSNRIQSLYGIYFHKNCLDMMGIFDSMFHITINERTFAEVIKQVKLDRGVKEWEEEFKIELACYTNSIDDWLVLDSLDIDKFISKAFYDKDEIYALLQERISINSPSPFIAHEILNYELTPVGYRLQKCLPLLLNKEPSFIF